MQKNENSQDMLFAAVVGGVLGMALASLYFSSKDGEKKSSSSLGRIVGQMSTLLEGSELRESPIVKETEKSVHKYEDTISEAIRLVSVGLKLWDKINKG